MGPPYNACPTHEQNNGDIYPYVGIATKETAHDSSEKYSWGSFYDGDEKYSCVQSADVRWSSDTSIDFVSSGRDPSATVANFFADLMDVDPSSNESTSMVVLSNPNAFGQDQDGNTSNGMPEKLNYLFMADLRFSVSWVQTYPNGSIGGENYYITCHNIILAQQTDDPYQLHWETALIKQGGGIVKDSIEIDEEDGVNVKLDEDTAETVAKDVAKDLKAIIKYELNKKYVWWMGQYYQNKTQDMNFAAVGSDDINATPAPNLPVGEYQHAFVCDDNFLMMVAGDTNSYNSFNVQFVKYKVDTSAPSRQ